MNNSENNGGTIIDIWLQYAPSFSNTYFHNAKTAFSNVSTWGSVFKKLRFVSLWTKGQNVEKKSANTLIHVTNMSVCINVSHILEEN